MLASGNDYLVTVKSNQRKLCQHLETYEEYLKPVSEHLQQQRNRGRDEYRQVRVYESGDDLEALGWRDVKSILIVERWGMRQGKSFRNKQFYMSSALSSAREWQRLVRGHWAIENRLHWPKDVAMGEDAYRLTDGVALCNWSLLRSLIINIIRLNGYKSVKDALRRLANRIDKISAWLT